jgi:dipeptidase E
MSSTGVARPARGLGLLPGSLSVHHHRDPDRRRALLQAVSLVIPPGYGVDDQAGLLFRGCELADAVSARPEVGAWRVESAAGGGWTEAKLTTRRLSDPRSSIDEPDAHVGELRRTLAARQGARQRD